MKIKIFTLFVCAMFTMSAFAQKPTALIAKTSEAPVIDGEIDDLWAEVEAHDVALNFQEELPTVGASTWQMLWDDDGLHLLLVVDDDEFYPNYFVDPVGASWEYDKPE
ncbi:MAG: hypothetical protein KAT15_29630, partial [Bacteroidales bacterium]|nr:hypothetical protein [Bacteroidales bacterium]